MYGVFLIVVLVITGGAIAFIGDRLGSKIGKKRLSLFGLRPRHTSILVTILTGVCITTLTFGVMAATSENVRTALFGMEKLNQNMRDTQAKLTQASGELASAQAEQQQTESDLKETKNELDDLQGQQRQLEERSRALLEGNRLLEQAKDELLLKNDVLLADNSRLDQSNTELEKNNAGLQTDNSRLFTDNRMLAERTEQLRQGIQIMREGDITFRAGEVLASGVIKGARDIKDIQRDMGLLMQAANRTVAQRLGNTVKEKDIWVYQPEYEEAAQFISRSPQDIVVRIVAAGNLVRGEAVRTTLQLYKNRTIYKDNEFILARPFKLKGSGDGEAERVVMSFLQDINAEASAKGILPDPLRGSIGVIEGNQLYDIIRQLTPINGTALLSAYARGNTDALGPLRVYLKVETR